MYFIYPCDICFYSHEILLPSHWWDTQTKNHLVARPLLAILAMGKWMASTGTKYILEARCSPWWNFLCCSGVSHLLMGTTMSVPFPHVSSGSSNISISAHNPKFQGSPVFHLKTAQSYYCLKPR